MGFFSEYPSSLANECSKTIVSIYINPTQFAENEDLSSYPKTIESDFKNLKKLNVDAVFLPTTREIYPQDKQNIFTYENKFIIFYMFKTLKKVYNNNKEDKMEG